MIVHRPCLMLMLPLMFLTSLAGCSQEAPPKIVDQSVRPAHVLQITTSVGERAYEFVGRVEAAQLIDLKFEVGGRITHLAAREGETIQTGTLVAAHEAPAGVFGDEPGREVLAPTLEFHEPVADEAVGMTLGRYKLPLSQ